MIENAAIRPFLFRDAERICVRGIYKSRISICRIQCGIHGGTEAGIRHRPLSGFTTSKSSIMNIHSYIILIIIIMAASRCSLSPWATCKRIKVSSDHTALSNYDTNTSLAPTHPQHPIPSRRNKHNYFTPPRSAHRRAHFTRRSAINISQ